MEVKLDSIDRRILSQLIDNSKMMSKEISRKLRIHPNTLLQRQKKLEASGIILRYSAVVDFTKFDKRMQVLIFLKVNDATEWESALQPLSRLPDIVSFSFISGGYDVLITARVKDEAHLADLIRKLRATKAVSRADTHLLLGHYKQAHEYNPLRDEFR